MKIAYIMSRFPKLTETFILYEMLAVEERGSEVEVFPLLRERQAVSHPEVERILPRVRFHPFVSPAILAAHLHYVVRRPRAYFGVLFEVLRGTWPSRNFLVGALGVFPKAVRFAFEMERLGVDHVHAHFVTHPVVAALIIRRLAGIPFSFTAHGSDLHVDRTMLGRKIEACAFGVTVSEFNRDVMAEECGDWVRDRVRVVHCGVDPEVFVPRDRRADEGPMRILCVASYEEVKGHRYLVEACAKLRERGVDFRCELVGDGPQRAEVEARIRATGLEDRVIVHGAQPRGEVVRLLSEVHAATLPSVPTEEGKKEGIPVALMEAMASGLPVVSSRLSGIPELVEHDEAGFLVAPRDPEGLAEAFARLAADPELRHRMGAAGRARILAEFDLRTNARKLIELFHETAGADAPSRELADAAI